MSLYSFIQQNFPAHKKNESQNRKICLEFHMSMMKLLAGNILLSSHQRVRESVFLFREIMTHAESIKIFFDLCYMNPMKFLLALQYTISEGLICYTSNDDSYFCSLLHPLFLLFLIKSVHNIFMVPHCTHLHHI